MLEKKEIFLFNDFYEKRATVYCDKEIKPRACIFYFHGGGLLYGKRDDLPKQHIVSFTQAGYSVISFDYPLAPTATIDIIRSDVCASITDFFENCHRYIGASLPFFLMGRSAGAYLCLLAAVSGKIPAPLGVVSYYGYGLLCDCWFNTPSSYYCTLPPVDDACLKHLTGKIYAEGELYTHYSIYVHARQTGKWMDLIYTGREKLFYLNSTLRSFNTFPCPLFCAHSISDPDVPYSEFLALSERFHPKQFIAPCREHDFDRDSGSQVTLRLLDETIAFLNHVLVEN